jgi:alkanesulfonate monooxygenase SsuD/methylene tetrahydromethanopterin reductase-like flavin-dependent oxidoreductase (luciferase family)
VRVDTNLLGLVHMSDPGFSGTPAVERRYGRQAFAAAYDDFVHLAKIADTAGFDTLWYTEHHFQHEGYEVVPNQILLGAYSAAVTHRVNFGQMFNIVPQWNPIRLAEDFAMADLLTKGRMRFGVGRGTVPREMQTLGATIESGDNGMNLDAERANREMFEEAMEVIKLAFANDRFSYSGKHFVYPPPGIPDRNTTVTELTLVPNVLREVEIYQACSSPKTLGYIAAQGHIGVYARQSPVNMAASWKRHADAAANAGRALAPGAERMLVLQVHIADSYETAVNDARDGHDELIKLLSPYGRFMLYDPPAGHDATPFDYAPAIEESIAQKIWAVGTAEDVAAVIDGYRETLDLQLLSVSFDSPGLTGEQTGEQMYRFAQDVAPKLGLAMM